MLESLTEKRREDLFFLVMVTAILAVNFIGFARTYFLPGVFHAPLPSIWVHIHGALFFSWLFLLLAQTVLVTAGRVGWHRRLGVLGGVIATLMLIAGPIVLVRAMRRHAFPRENEAVLIFVADVIGLALFAVLVLMGLRYRNQPMLHKRLMLFATIAILPQGLSRWEFSFMRSIAVFYGMFLAFPLAILLYDLLSRRRTIRFDIACAALLAAYILGIVPLSHWQVLHTLERQIAGTSETSR